MEEEQSLFFLKFGEKLLFSDIRGLINEEISMDFTIKVDDKIINLYEILISLNRQNKSNMQYLINKDNEVYIIKNKETNTEYRLDSLLILFFQKMKEKIETSKEISIKKVILIYHFIPYEIRLIIQQAVYINELKIIHMIDDNKALRYYLDSRKEIVKSLKDSMYISIIIIYNNLINISVYKSKTVKKLFNASKEISDIFQNIKFINDDNYILLDNPNNEQFLKIKEYIVDLIEKDMGNQDLKNIDKIFIFNSKNILKELFFGAANSLNFKKTQECLAIFKIIDKKYENKNKDIGIMIGKNKYNFSELNKNEYHFLLDEELLFEDCFYKTLLLIIYDSMNTTKTLITIYFGQINYYYISLDMKYCNSIELIFFKYEPQINFNDQEYEIINYEEKFEDKETFKRINLININREKIKLNLISDDYNKIFRSKFDINYKNLTLVIGDKLEVLSHYQLLESTEKTVDTDLYLYLKDANFLSSELSLKEIECYKNNLKKMINGVKYQMNFMSKMEEKYLDIWNDASILINYGKYVIFEDSFIDGTNNVPNYNEDNHKKFQKIMKNIENFHEKCKNYIKDDNFVIAQLFCTACLALTDYLKYNIYSDTDLDGDLIDLIDFRKKGTIYNAGYENNLELIKNLNKDSFLYPIFLQFNSGFRLMKIDGEYFPTCKISKLTLEQIKFDLIKSLNRYGVRIFFKTRYLADTSLNTNITIYNEKNIFNKKLEENELLTSNDTNYHKRTSISFLQKHERFCHVKKTFNKIESNYVDSPRGYLDFCSNQIRMLISIRNEETEKGEIGESFEYFLTNGKIFLIDHLYKCKNSSFNFNNLFNIKLLLEKTNENFIINLKLIPENQEEINNIGDNNIVPDDDENNIDENYDAYNNRKSKFDISIDIKRKEIKIDNKNKINDDYIQEKNRLINESIFRKYTFEKNTICEYRFDKTKNKFVPYNKYP